MGTKEYLRILRNEIHSTVFAGKVNFLTCPQSRSPGLPLLWEAAWMERNRRRNTVISLQRDVRDVESVFPNVRRSV